MSKQEELIIKELLRREKGARDIRADLFPEQKAFIDDPSRLKALQCDRRAGKSMTAGNYFTLVGLENPRCTMLYIAMVREQAKRIMYKDILKAISRKYSLNFKFNEVTLQVTFPNGSFLYLMGTDSSPEEADKLLGQKYKLVLLDESASYKQDQRYLVESVLLPATADMAGTIALLGSAQNNTSTFFYDILERRPPDPKAVQGWSVHKWGWQQNPHVRENMQKHIDMLVKNNPAVVDTPVFQQMYMNKWVVDPGARVYKFDAKKNLADYLPRDHEYYYTLSCDFGYEDPTAFTIAAHSTTDPDMYFVEALKRQHMDITDVANVLEMFKQKYHPVKYVVDGSSKQGVEELRKRFAYPLTAADRAGKSDIIEIMNADLIMGRVKILPPAMILVDEWKSLIWDTQSDKRVELRSCQNNLSDSALYNWRMCYHYASRALVKRPTPGSNEAVDAWWEREAKMAISKKKQSFSERDFGGQYGIRRLR